MAADAANSKIEELMVKIKNQSTKNCPSTKYTPIQRSQSHNMDLNSLINSWWVKGATKRKTVEPTTEKVSLHGENQTTICLICDQNFKCVKHCLEHIQILHGLQNTFENKHYQIRGHSDEDSTFPIQEIKADVQRKKSRKDENSKPKPKVATTHEGEKRPRKFIPPSDQLGLQTGLFPTEYIEEVTKLVREDEILVPTPQMKTKANQEVTFNAAPQNVIELHRRLVNGTNQLFNVPQSIPAMIRSPYMQQAYGPNDTCIFCKKGMHKYQIFCPILKQLQPQEIRRLMKENNIECEMCLGTNHVTAFCTVNIKRCKIKTSGTECGAKHFRLLHQKEGKGQQITTNSGETATPPRLTIIGGSKAPNPKVLAMKQCSDCRKHIRNYLYTHRKTQYHPKGVVQPQWECKHKKESPKEEHAATMEPFDQEYGITNSKEYFEKQFESSESE